MGGMVRRPGRNRRRILAAATAIGMGSVAVGLTRTGEKRVAVVEPGKVVRGAWQSAAALRSVIDREGIRTVVTLTAINRDDPKYVEQERVVRESGVDWVLVPMRGSTATAEQMGQAADLMADPKRQPVFVHCVAGHHRSNLAHAAFLIRHKGMSAQMAWAEVARLPWTRPDAGPDRDDRRKIEAFAAGRARGEVR